MSDIQDWPAIYSRCFAISVDTLRQFMLNHGLRKIREYDGCLETMMDGHGIYLVCMDKKSKYYYQESAATVVSYVAKEGQFFIKLKELEDLEKELHIVSNE